MAEQFRGRFIADAEALRQKLFRVKAFVFDWDGVFNSGFKDELGSSPYSEVDAMGTNLLRFNHYLRNGTAPVCCIISGEHNKAAAALADREHFHAVYCGIKFKAMALDHLCAACGITAEEVAFVFDDVLDLSLAEKCGLRIMVNRNCNPLLMDFAVQQGLVDYITAHDGAGHAVRETAELLTGLSGLYDRTITERMRFTELYRQYLERRNRTTTAFFTASATEIITYRPA